jgi:hypothetical protein
MMVNEDLLRKSVCDQFSLEKLDGGDYLVHTDKYFDDGDELHIVLKTDGEMVLSDEGHTMMWLSYENFNLTPTRERILSRIIGQNNVSFEDGRITVSVKSVHDFGSSLSSIVQAVIQVADMRRLSHANVASTFVEDILAAYLSSSLKDRCQIKKKIHSKTGDVIEPDIYIESESPVLVFGVNNTEKAKEVFINLMFVRDSGDSYRTVVIIDDDAGVPSKDYRRLINAADRPIVGKDDAVSITEQFIEA